MTRHRGDIKRLVKIGDSDYGRWRDGLDLPTTVEQDLACLKLERMGKRFLVDFGYENAQNILRTERRRSVDEEAQRS